MFYGEAVERQLRIQRKIDNLDRHLQNTIVSEDQYSSLLELRGVWHMLSWAQPFWWSTSSAVAVLANSEHYPQIPLSRDLLFCDHGWCVFERPLQLPYKFAVTGLLWSYRKLKSTSTGDAHTGLAVDLFGDRPGDVEYQPMVRACLLEGDILQEQLNRRSDQSSYIAEAASLRFVLAAGAWLRQRILTTHEERPNHQTRKTIKREMGNIKIPNIQVVQLRRTASAPHDSASVSERDWHCQWMVRGHWRNQYYASSGDHMPKYIHPYIKGPEDKPLKPPSGEIFAVTR